MRPLKASREVRHSMLLAGKASSTMSAAWCRHEPAHIQTGERHSWVKLAEGRVPVMREPSREAAVAGRSRASRVLCHSGEDAVEG